MHKENIIEQFKLSKKKSVEPGFVPTRLTAAFYTVTLQSLFMEIGIFFHKLFKVKKIITVKNLYRFTVGTKRKRHRTVGIHFPLSANKYKAGTILVDPNQNQRGFLNTCIHEMLHKTCPGWTETRVKEVTHLLTRGIWEQGYRKEFKVY